MNTNLCSSLVELLLVRIDAGRFLGDVQPAQLLDIALLSHNGSDAVIIIISSSSSSVGGDDSGAGRRI